MKITTRTLLGGLLLCTTLSFTQVGINTTAPAGVLDISASNLINPKNTDGILIPRVQAFPTDNPTADQDGMLLFLNATDGTSGRGFYFWDNAQTKWVGFTDEWRDGVNASGDDFIFAAQAKNSGTDMVITYDGRIGFGTDDPVERFEFRGPGDNDFQITSANTNPPNFILYNTGGTLDAPDALGTNQEIGSFIVKTHDGAGIREPGGFRFFMDGTPTVGSTPSRFVINTTPSGSTSQRPRLIVRHNGNVGISEQNPTASLHIRAGSATANSAPLKLTEGPMLTTPEKGAFEFDNNTLYFTGNTSRETIFKGFSNSVTLNFAVVAQGDMQERNATVTGAKVGQTCNCTPRVRPESPLMWNCFVSAPNVVTLRMINPGNMNVTTTASDWEITVIDF